MEEKLRSLYDSLCEIRKYLIKIGPERRKGNIVVVKLKEADKLLSEYNLFLGYYTSAKKSLSTTECSVIQDLCASFDKLYKQVFDLCSKTPCESATMAETTKFDLKVALNLLPVCKDDEASVRQFIESVEYYKSELDVSSQAKLLNFVLKSRLSPAAKLKLSSSYPNIDEFIADMKTQLLPKKCATAIQRRLQNFKQSHLSIDEFGKQITEMFVELTISQSDGNDASFKVLKPLNEKQAIKYFADGLRNRRLSTIISAQKFTSLKDAIQSAIDEDVTTPSTSNEILTLNYRGRSFQNRPQRGGRPSFAGRGRGRVGYQPTTRYGDQTQVRRGPQANGRRATGTFHGNRGRSNFYSPRYQRSHYSQIHTLNNSDSQQSSNTTENEQEENQFFRD